ncbi:hypothetical protein BKE38_03390 [Pseudoroseomonas deserti]|uniref:Uncharacterized protein n=1 Tax=Teichococcus deserti TaxID=1817963 RepID=A0A1V2H8Y5_9PROT|nr:J domain-containing protein [Pseudoroseomonas deserti]ONG58146.1 hypothetical protein BKE38_03390 [Pseudoroseomonas deserti]
MPASPTASALLAVPLEDAARLFPGDAAAVRAGYHRLAIQWHPDHCQAPMADAVFSHLTRLRDAALRGLADAAPEVLPGGRRFQPRRRHAIETGTLLVGDAAWAWVIEPGQADLARNAAARIAGLRFADAAMRAQMAPLLPQVLSMDEGIEGTALLMRREPTDILLRDTVEAAGGALGPRHVAWICSGLLHLACFLAVNRLVHGDIGPESVCIAPESHRVGLPGGWWYATPEGAPMPALPLRSVDVAPAALLDDGLADPALDQALIRRTGREIAGPLAALPPPLADWLGQERFSDAVTEYGRWQQVLEASFGPRRFAVLDLDARSIYR